MKDHLVSTDDKKAAQESGGFDESERGGYMAAGDGTGLKRQGVSVRACACLCPRS